MSVGLRSDNGRLFHSFGAQAAKLRGPKLDVRQASTGRLKMHDLKMQDWKMTDHVN